MTNLTRRTAIVATAAAPLASIAAQAGQEDDPAVALYEEWLAAHERYCACFATHPEDDDPVMIAANEADHAAALRLAHRAVPVRPSAI